MITLYPRARRDRRGENTPAIPIRGISLIGLLAGLFLLPACVDGGGGGGGPLRMGDPLPDYAGMTLDGDSVSLRDFQGEVVLLNIWATWCPACEREIPSLQALHEDLEPRGLRVVGVSIDPPGSEGTVREFLEEYGISYTILYDPRGRVSDLFGIFGIPTSYVADRRGVVVKLWIGEADFGAEAIKARLDSALADQRGAEQGDPDNA